MTEVNFGLLDTDSTGQQKKAFDYAQQIQDLSTNRQAGAQYAAGNLPGASATLAQSGNIPDALKVDQTSQTRAAAGQKYIQDATSLFSSIAQSHANDPDKGAAALTDSFNHIAAEAKDATGISDQQLANIKQRLGTDPQGTVAEMVARIAPKFVSGASGTHFFKEQGNQITDTGVGVPAKPQIPDGYRLAGDGKSFEAVPGGPADPEVIHRTAADKRSIIVNNPTQAQAGTPTDDKTIDYLAHRYLAGDVTALNGLGRNGANKLKVIQRAQSITDDLGGTPEGDAAAASLRKANSAALDQNTKMAANVAQAEITAQKNADLVLQLAPAGVGPTKTPLIDAWVQAGRKGVGSADVAKFDTAIKTFATEYARVMSGGSGNQQLSDTARNEVDKLINRDENLEQIKGTIEVMRKDMANRKAGIAEEHDAIVRQLGGSPAPSAPAAAPNDGIPTVTSPAAALKLPPGTKFRTPDGRIKVR